MEDNSKVKDEYCNYALVNNIHIRRSHHTHCAIAKQ